MVTLGLYRGYIGIMEKNMETIEGLGCRGRLSRRLYK